MRVSSTPLASLLVGFAAILPTTLAVFQDEAFQNDWHIPLLGPSLRESTFFHRPLLDAKASLIYTLTERNILAALHPKDGGIVWRHQLEACASKKLARAVEGVVVTGSCGNVKAFDAVTGKLAWENRFVGGNVKDFKSAGKEDAVVVLFDDGSVRMLEGGSGIVMWEWKDLNSKDTPYSISVTRDSVLVVSVQPEKTSNNMHITSLVLESGLPAKFSGDLRSSVESVDNILSSDGLMAWTEDDLRTLKMVPLSGSRLSDANVKIPEGVIDIEVHTDSDNVALVHYKTADKSWATAYRWQYEYGPVLPFLDIEEKPGADSTFSISKSGGQTFFVWSFANGEAFLYGEQGQLAEYSPKVECKWNHITNAASEVITRSDGASYAVRSFVSTSTPGFKGNTHLVRNGDLEWTRKESLASVSVSTFAELLDPAAEKVADELNAEGHKSVGAAYVHRLTRHMQELIEYGPAWVSGIPVRVMDAFLNKEKAEIGGKWRDFFGYRKYAIVATEEGGLAALDIGKKGEIAWESNVLPTEGEWKGALGVYEVSKGVVAVVTKGGEYLEFDAFEGTMLHREKIPGCGTIKSSSTVDGIGRKVVLAVLKCGKVMVLPSGSPLPETVYLAVQDDAGHAKGLKVASSGKPEQTWVFNPPTNEQIASISTRPAHDPIASIGKVLGDRSVMYKYINPHLISIVTADPNGSTASIHLLDSVSGAVLHSATHTGVDTSKPIVSTVSENWVVYSYYGDDTIPGKTAAKGYHLVVSEIFESEQKNDRGPLGGAQNYSALAGETGEPFVLSQSFIFPGEITSLATTTTRQGITSHDILALLPEYSSILGLPKRMLDPRRPVGRDANAGEMEEGLVKYFPVIDADPRGMLNHKRELVGIKKIVTTPALLESTSLVFAYGGDLFGTRVTPSMAFDVLAKGFSKIQLVGTIVALGVGVGFVAPMVRRKQINQRWSNS